MSDVMPMKPTVEYIDAAATPRLLSLALRYGADSPQVSKAVDRWGRMRDEASDPRPV